MTKIKALIVDDSVLYRSLIRGALQMLEPIEIIGAASNGRLALERLRQTPTDLMILDLEMPELDGLQTLKEVAQAGGKTKVIVFSSVSKAGADKALEALKLGASDFISKPGSVDAAIQDQGGSDPGARIRAALEPRIRALFPARFSQTSAPMAETVSKPKAAAPPAIGSSVTWSLFRPKILVIGSSTGGPTVLERIFSEISVPLCCPVVIVQHMPATFTAQLAARLERLSRLPTTEARQDMILENKVYVAPGDYHCRLTGTKDGQVKFSLDKGPLIQSVRPAVDPLFESAANIFGRGVLAFVLTGMGSDGRDGAESVKSHGGTVVIQNAETCVVFGMPGAVYAAGAFDRIATPEELVEIIREKACGMSSGMTT